MNIVILKCLIYWSLSVTTTSSLFNTFSEAVFLGKSLKSP